jgi:phage anti-repressor protein
MSDNEIESRIERRLIASELIPIYENHTGKKEVDGRELHSFLLVGRDFTSWIKNRIEQYRFIENIDYVVTLTKTGERQNVTRHDYSLSIGMAKELSMLENNDRGSQARKHFIAIEERYNSQIIDVSQLPPEMQMFKQLWDGLARSHLKNQALEREQGLLRQEVSGLQEGLNTLTDNLTAVPDQSKVVDLLNDYVRWVRLDHREVYNLIYGIMLDQHGIDVPRVVENERKRLNDQRIVETGKPYAEKTLKSKVSGITIMVRMGVLDKFHTILVGLFAKAKGERRL